MFLPGLRAIAPLLYLHLLLTLPQTVRGDVEFTSPAAGAKVDVGTIDVQWKESGVSPPIVDLTVYTLVLLVGGNNDGNDTLTIATFQTEGDFSSGNNASGTIPAGIAGPVENGFFFKIMSASSAGESVINYSNRFSITGLSGYTPPEYREAVEALGGSMYGPGNAGDNAVTSSVINAPTSTATGPARVTVTEHPTASGGTGDGPSHGGGGGAGEKDGSAMSTGALAGIAVAGVLVGLAATAFALWVFLRRRKRRQQHGKEQGEIFAKFSNDSSDLSRETSYTQGMTQTPAELDPYASRVTEADDGMPPPELDSTVRAELAGDFVHWEPQPPPPLTPVPDTPLSVRTLDGSPSLTPTDLRWPVMPRDNV
ncbi:Cell wall synthesis protein kre9 precursor [Vermiconidia calcicola]|uniref:Cell wall synthesis protein kre9 n=1 Tax=Vermiconidia calcicola TaxID=1690605 RepID=A0ACC3MHG6_9PEZI|nr:Cell wall synthesis protein kre9 precursor [Vermiconidia calcicola]